MYAIILSGGKQYKVMQNDIILVEKLDANVGDKIELDAIFKSEQGNIDTNNFKVSAQVVGHTKGKKIVVFKYKPKKNIRKKQGHRQHYTKLKILAV